MSDKPNFVNPWAILDVDGVLNADSDWADETKHHSTKGNMVLCPDKVARFKRLVDTTGCKVVLSSTWRFYVDAKAALNKLGITWDETTQTRYKKTTRCSDINLFLQGKKMRGEEITNFVILDDDPSVGRYDYLAARWILTLERIGLQDAHIDRAIELLGAR